MIRGALAASVTPLTEGGAALAEDAFQPLVDFYVEAGLDGILALGTTGEGILLSQQERRAAAERFLEAAAGRFHVVVHCGAQTTADTAALAAHAAERGAAAVAAIGPPYFAFDEEEIFAHFAAVAAACAPKPFYLYEFAARSGYAVPLAVIERLREAAPNLAGLKVSDVPFEAFEPYLIEGLDIFVGPESLIDRGLGLGAVGAVSGLAAGFPEAVVQLVRSPSAEAAARVGELRAAMQRFPFQSALKTVLRSRGLPLGDAVRRPLRPLTAEERRQVEALAAASADAVASGVAGSA